MIGMNVAKSDTAKKKKTVAKKENVGLIVGVVNEYQV
jgi:hypothetical protein